MSGHGAVEGAVELALAAVVAFLVGAVNPATIIARMLGTDLSTSGSGNPGAANAGRVLGRTWGVVVGVLDVLKGLVPTVVAGQWLGTSAAYAVGLAAVLGHIWSPYLRGRGGKGVATTFGTILGVHPLMAVVVFVAFAVTWVIFRRVAVGSIAGAVAMIVTAVVLAVRDGSPMWTPAWLTALASAVLWRHKNNVIGWWRQRRLAG